MRVEEFQNQTYGKCQALQVRLHESNTKQSHRRNSGGFVFHCCIQAAIRQQSASSRRIGGMFQYHKNLAGQGDVREVTALAHRRRHRTRRRGQERGTRVPDPIGARILLGCAQLTRDDSRAGAPLARFTLASRASRLTCLHSFTSSQDSQDPFKQSH